MSGDAWLTLVVVLLTVGGLVTERVSAPLAIIGAVTVLLVAGVIDADQALSGFSNPAPFTVAALYVLAGAAEATGALEVITARILRGVAPGEAGDRRALFRVVVPTAGASAFLNNTPIVGMVAPGVLAWARRTGRDPSQFLMPVSFAAILGGLMTVIGTSTNLVVSGLLEDSGHDPIGLFEISAVGLPLAAGGVILMWLAAFRFLPVRRTPEQDLADLREFTVEMIVSPNSSLAGRTIADANLRNLEGVFLVEIERGGRRMAPVAPDEVLVDGDRLTFAGNVGRVLDLQRIPGLASAEEPHFDYAGGGLGRRLYEAVIAEDSPLSGRTLKDVSFRARYGAAVLAIHRAGGRIPGKLGSVVLRPGDVLLVLSDPQFRPRWAGRGDFLIIASLDGDAPPRKEKAPVVGIVMVALLALVGTNVLDILEASLLAAFVLVVLGVLSANEARNSVDVNVIVVIAGSFGVGAAISQSGLADQLASALIEPFEGLGGRGLILGVMLATLVLTELITNNAAAVLMFPIAISIASQAGLDPRGFAIAVAIGASASFLTPIGYQTNTMVYGMGGYRFGDFARLGWPLTIVVVGLSVLLIPAIWPLT
ncbi:MAG: SLC13 family permease [Actinomycetota bacterium]